MLLKTIVERSRGMVRYLLRHASWFITLPEGYRIRVTANREYMDDEINEGRNYEEVRRLVLQTHQLPG